MSIKALLIVFAACIAIGLLMTSYAAHEMLLSVVRRGMLSNFWTGGLWDYISGVPLGFALGFFMGYRNKMAPRKDI